ncbi:GGDEF domain-containing protein [Desulfuromonas versatilis]|uniref:GGDEF domain-containing protein n=1 Tax=Desulfuromonas versatilis TaxID=2802975 RepID=UPI001C8442DE|nr:GGDEF domain-containing protein [Desulfuromonas versatilis]
MLGAVCIVAVSTLNDISARIDAFSALGGSGDATAWKPLAGPLLEISGLAREAVLWVVILGAAGLVGGFFLALLAVFHILSALGKLKYATHLIAEGIFDLEPQIRSRDEIGDLARELSVMAKKFKQYEQMCLDASPLTRLPGNIAIERSLLEKMRKGEKFALCYIDLDNFKAYNDRYGYAKGSEIIKATGELVYNMRKSYGREGDFVGHIGGDDFVLITAPENIKALCENIIHGFDKLIPRYYSPEDLERGFVVGIDRYGVERQFPIMTISIAVVSDAHREIASPTEIAQVAAEIKDFVKTLPGSNYLVDRRRNKR